ncbi:pyridoxal phosphate-dependent aminotransferase [Candidatus Dependentiae bacterium]|nr:pyridoxal phosphate-dependent aminotransferase [Candidatus Dependentiae bacterium]MBU4387548.1 pyridoxal phosphate-dependent aminotransferase [Candidatus Dependentiae bacterium]MCG2756623.1 pyridoxal phosphate-dependent aminotransferase [Candidatus Dependentiae bacterium]
MLTIPLSGIKKIESIAQSSNEYISLSQGALKVGGIPKEIKTHLQNILNTDKTDYYQSAWGILPLRERISKFIFDQDGIKVDTNQIIVTHGCIGALSTLFLTLLEPGDEVIIPEPTYPAYDKLTKLARANSIFVSMTNDQKNSNQQWYLDIEKIKKATTSKTKILIFSNPWNPLGIIIDEQTIKELLDWCEQNKIYLIIDEAYKDYAFDKSYKSTVKFVTKSEYFINVNTFSKSMGMSGWRVGYMVIPNSLNIAVGSMQDALLNCTNIPSQHAALYALDHYEFTKKFHDQTEINLDITCEKLKPLVEKNIFSYQKPMGSFFIFLKTQYDDSESLVLDILKQAKVSLIPGKDFGDSGKQFIRLCFAREANILIEGLDRITKYFL